jgi:hypothetical protein
MIKVLLNPSGTRIYQRVGDVVGKHHFSLEVREHCLVSPCSHIMSKNQLFFLHETILRIVVKYILLM